ncbi:probable E3 SUMO-protein ligase RNF212 [Cololabis saira]|uniref:probable E3 SUMO-protein ligase RNF212 n=1 Tax=Cololabis saira TaxID=129043 RepID=UPI002AD3A9EC|nr:probable E3 SUMO-protein ligase RNF212 [Cololabis saira]
MSYWVCCNSCFCSPGAERRLAVSTCGHVVCNVCYQKGNQGKCLICGFQCQISPLSDKSSSDVKALFSDINSVATKHLTEISNVVVFQSRHQKRLLSYYEQRSQKLEEVLVKMKQEMQQMAKKLNEQNVYIAKLENSLQHQSAKASSVSQISRSSHNVHGHKQVLQIPFSSPVSLSRFSPAPSMPESMELDGRSLFRKPTSAPRLSLIKTPHDGRMVSLSHRSSNQNMPPMHTARSATISRFQGPSFTPDFSHS